MVGTRIQRSDSERPPQGAEHHLVAIDRLDHCRRGFGSPQRQDGEVIGCSCPRRSSLCVQDPPWKSPTVWPQGPAPAGIGIHKGEDCFRWALQGIERADPFEVVERGLVAGKQEMVAIINAAAELRIQIRTTAPAGIAARLIKPHVLAFGGQPDSSGEASKTGPDDMHRARPCSHTSPCRNASQSLRGFDTLKGVAGSRHPERSKAESVAW